MKRLVALLLVISLVLCGCSKTKNEEKQDKEPNAVLTQGDDISSDDEEDEDEILQVLQDESGEPLYADWTKVNTGNYNSLDDEGLLRDVEDNVFSEVALSLNSSEYTIESVEAVYLSKEYVDELEYNSKTNVFFGYSLSDLNEQFQGQKYVFTLGKEGTTTVEPFEQYDATLEKVMKNVAIGSGVILVCVVVSAVTAGAGAPAVSMIFAASAKTAAEMAVSSAVISGTVTGIVTGIETGDMQKALKEAALVGSESFKWGAITGAVSGGTTQFLSLRSAASGGLTMDEAATIMKEKNLPSQFVKQIHSMDEYNSLLQVAEQGGLSIEEMAQLSTSTQYPLEVIKRFKTTDEGKVYFDQAELMAQKIGDNYALVRDIDLNRVSVDKHGVKMTNLERMQAGKAPVDASGHSYELHHIGQETNSPLAILTKAEHTMEGNNGILHDVNISDGQGVHSLLSDSAWGSQRKKFWKEFAKLCEVLI